MSGFVSYSFRLNIIVLKILGLYPSKSYYKIHRAYAVVLFIVSMAPSFVVGVLHFVYTADLAHINNSDLFLIAMQFYTLKLIPFVTNGTQVEKIVIYFEATCYAITKPERINIIVSQRAEEIHMCSLLVVLEEALFFSYKYLLIVTKCLGMLCYSV